MFYFLNRYYNKWRVSGASVRVPSVRCVRRRRRVRMVGSERLEDRLDGLVEEDEGQECCQGIKALIASLEIS